MYLNKNDIDKKIKYYIVDILCSHMIRLSMKSEFKNNLIWIYYISEIISSTSTSSTNNTNLGSSPSSSTAADTYSTKFLESAPKISI